MGWIFFRCSVLLKQSLESDYYTQWSEFFFSVQSTRQTVTLKRLLPFTSIISLYCDHYPILLSLLYNSIITLYLYHFSILRSLFYNSIITLYLYPYLLKPPRPIDRIVRRRPCSLIECFSFQNFFDEEKIKRWAVGRQSLHFTGQHKFLVTKKEQKNWTNTSWCYGQWLWLSWIGRVVASSIRV